jgi:hypothetical protein
MHFGRRSIVMIPWPENRRFGTSGVLDYTERNLGTFL